MKVLMLSIDAKIFESGSAVQDLMREYGTIVDELHIVVYTKPGFSETQIAPNVWAYPTNTAYKPVYFLDGYRLGRMLILEKGIDLITSQEALTNIVGLRLKRNFNVPLQAQVHVDFASPEFVNESFGNRVRYFLYKETLKRVDGIRVVSERIRKSIEAIGIQTPIAVLPIFVDIANIESLPTISLHNEHPEFDFIVAMVGRLAIEKDYETALGAMAELLKVHPKAGLVIFGEGVRESALRALSRDLDIEDSIVFAGFHGNVLYYVKTADAVMVTSRYEGYGRMLVEAAALGRAIVSTDVGVVGDILKNNDSVLVCPLGDEDCFKKSLERLLNDTGERERLGAAALTRAKKAAISKPEYLSRMRRSFEVCQASKGAAA